MACFSTCRLPTSDILCGAISRITTDDIQAVLEKLREKEDMDEDKSGAGGMSPQMVSAADPGGAGDRRHLGRQVATLLFLF